MNLKVKANEIEIEIMNADQTFIERVLLGVFSKESFEQGFSSTVPAKTTKNYVEAIEGVRTHTNGTKEYKCAYSCTCKNNGVRYIHKDATVTTCHKCKAELYVVSVNTDFTHDADFNYFIAY